MNKFLALVLALLLIVGCVSLGDAEKVKLAYSTGSLRLRKGPGTEYETVDYLSNGENITVLQYGSVWSKIETFSGSVGYIKNLYISGNGVEYADGTTYYDSRKTATVTTKYADSKVNLRAGAASSEKSLKKLSNGTTIYVLGVNGSWYLVETADGTQGYMYKSYVSIKSSSSASTTFTATVTGSRVYMRAGAGIVYDRLDILTKGTKVTVLSTSNSKWWKIKYDGQTGYMYSAYLKK